MLSPSNCYLDKKQAQPLRFSTEELIRKRLRSHKCRARTHGHAACLSDVAPNPGKFVPYPAAGESLVNQPAACRNRQAWSTVD